MQIKEEIQAWNKIRNSQKGFQFLQAGSGFTLSKEEFQQWNSSSDYVHLYLANQNDALCFYLIDDYHDQAQEYILGQTIFKKQFIHPTITAKQQPPLVKQANNLLIQFLQELNNRLQAASHSTLEQQKQSLEEGCKKMLDQLHTPLALSQFQQAIQNQIDAVIPSFRWLMFSPQWFEELAQAEKVVQAFKIPFQDFKFLFEEHDSQEAFLFFGLKDTPKEDFSTTIDVFLSQYDPNKKTSEEISFVLANRTADISTPCPPYHSYDLPLLN